MYLEFDFSLDDLCYCFSFLENGEVYSYDRLFIEFEGDDKEYLRKDGNFKFKSNYYFRISE